MKRHLLRLWVSPEDNRPLPDVYVSHLLLWIRPDLACCLQDMLTPSLLLAYLYF